MWTRISGMIIQPGSIDSNQKINHIFELSLDGSGYPVIKLGT